MRNFGRTLVLLFVTASPLAAQYPIGAVGFQWTGVTTPAAGNFCWGFTCTPIPVTVTAGETFTVLMRGGFNQPYAIGFSATATRCMAVPGFFHSLILDDPITLVWTGTLSHGSPILSCPPGYDTLTVTLPPFFPVGMTFALQCAVGADGLPAGMLSFTSALAISVI